MQEDTSIELKDIRKSYGALEIIPGLSAKLGAGEFTVILGPSGCGKSTLLNMLAGLEPVTSGIIRFGDRDVQNVPAKDRGCAMVFQNYALYPHMSVGDNIGYSLKIARIPKQERLDRIAAVAGITDLAGYLERRPSQLSGGQRQRVAIARAIVREPQVLLFDEPLSNLDAKLRNGMRMELSQLHKRIGATSVFVTHDQVEAMTLADKILIINKGQIEQFGTPNEIYHQPASAFVAGFIGSPPMNILKGYSESGALKIDGMGQIGCTSLNGSLLIGIRPERIELGSHGLSGVVQYREDLGSHIILLVRLQNGEDVSVSVPHAAQDTHQTDVHLTFPEDALHVFDAKTQKRIEP